MDNDITIEDFGEDNLYNEIALNKAVDESDLENTISELELEKVSGTTTVLELGRVNGLDEFDEFDFENTVNGLDELDEFKPDTEAKESIFQDENPLQEESAEENFLQDVLQDSDSLDDASIPKVADAVQGSSSVSKEEMIEVIRVAYEKALAENKMPQSMFFSNLQSFV